MSFLMQDEKTARAERRDMMEIRLDIVKMLQMYGESEIEREQVHIGLCLEIMPCPCQYSFIVGSGIIVGGFRKRKGQEYRYVVHREIDQTGTESQTEFIVCRVVG